ncbi:hypothetical protein Tco_1279006, partial [Tanacetum coccineum]
TSIYDFMTLPSWSDAKTVEEPHHLSLPMLERVPSHITALAMEGAIIPKDGLDMASSHDFHETGEVLQEDREKAAGTLLESADQKEIKKAEEEMQRTLDIKQKTIGVDWTGHVEDEQENFALMAYSNSGLDTEMSTRDKSGLGYGNQIHEGVLSYEKEVLESVFDSRLSDVENSPVYDRFVKVEGMHAVPPPMTGNYMPPKYDFRIDVKFYICVETLESVPEPVVVEPKVVSQPKVWSDAPIIKEYELDSDDEYVIEPSKEQEKPSFAFVNIVKHAKTPRETVKEQNTCSPTPKVNKRD